MTDDDLFDVRGPALRHVGVMRVELSPMDELQHLTEDFGGYGAETLREVFKAHPGIPWARAMAEVPHVDDMAPTALARSALAYMSEAQPPLAVMLAAAPEGSHVVAGSRAWVRGARGWLPAGSTSVTLGPATLAGVIGGEAWTLCARGNE